VGLLFEAPVDSPVRQRYPDALDLSQLMGDGKATKERAFRIATTIIDGEPELRGLAQMKVFSEPIIGELEQVIRSFNVHDRLVSSGIGRCVFEQPSRIAEELKWLGRVSGKPLEVVIRTGRSRFLGHPRLVQLRRSFGRLQDGAFDAAALANEFRLLVDRVDPFHRRERQRAPISQERGRTWFYTTAKTFTDAGLAYEGYFPERFEFLVENPATGGVPLARTGRRFSSPYSFGANDIEPTPSELEVGRNSLLEHVGAAKLVGSDALVRDAFLGSAMFLEFLERLLPTCLFMTSLFERIVREVRPSAVVVGNPGWEGFFLHAARRAGLPTVLLQHGILGDFCQFIDPPVDHYVVRGAFWREFLSPSARLKSSIVNPPERSEVGVPNSHKRRIVTFVTAPYRLEPLWDEQEMIDIIKTLASACECAGAELVIRVHPLEQVGHYRTLVRQAQSGKPVGGPVTYSQGDGLDDLLARSAVAVTYASTVFLACLRHSVPIVGIGWHDFSYKHLIEKYGVFTFCQGIKELGEVVARALKGQLKPFDGAVEMFEARMDSERVRNKLRGLIEKPTA